MEECLIEGELEDILGKMLDVWERKVGKADQFLGYKRQISYIIWFLLTEFLAYSF